MGYDIYYEIKYPDEEGVLIGWQKGKLKEKGRGIKKLQSEPNTGEDIYQKKQIAIFVDLEPLTNPGVVLKIVNTHLFWDYNKENIKYYQALKLLQWLDGFKEENIIVCGDFNAVPDGNVVNMILGRKIPPTTDEKKEEIIKTELKRIYENYLASNIVKEWSSAYGNYNPKGKTHTHPEFSCYTERYHSTIDYIFYNKHSKLKVVDTLPILPEEEAKAEKGLPNSKFGSDHLPLVSKFAVPTN